ncbi:SDR family NAD(P)-dependent oxidoreductase [uncultured Sphingomonas sp.]|uniref:SDR family NAD(P)-dependent oxidoreductase n=1 Tax=uncultured Sphingomonas sp. TaxID=158754 RepID=UPI0025CB7981|nr:SDR family NAD(P)-dependent oxidoreductase [uncultured Sphingomonas sp.]
MQDKPVALITGANNGIGLQIAKDLSGHGFTVLVGARDLKAGKAAAAGIEGDAHAVQLDVTDPTSVATAAEHIRAGFGRLDVLVNNAGISHAGKPGASFDEVIQSNLLTAAPLDDIRTVWETNVFGVIAVTQAMLPLLRQEPAARIVIVGSGAGSLSANSDPAYPYRAIAGNYTASKTAVHGVGLAFALALEAEGIKVNIADPGYTATSLNGFTGHRTVEQGARRAVELALLDADGPTGTLSDENGPVAW